MQHINTVLISGSPRKGNTEFILSKISQNLTQNNKLFLLRKMEIKHCLGCLNCHKKFECIQKDDMRIILKCLKEASLLIVGSPNYFDSVSSLTKVFIDRTHPFYKEKLLKGKKLISVVIGGGKIKHSKRIVDYDFRFFADTHEMEYIGGYCFRGLNVNDIAMDRSQNEKLNIILSRINEGTI